MHARSQLIRARSTIACVSSPAAGSRTRGPSRHPGAWRRTHPRRLHEEWRTSRLPCSATAIISTTRRATGSRPAGSARRAYEIVGKGVELRIGASGLGDLAEEHLHRLRLALHRPQDVEADDVARPLPDAVERGLAIEPLHQVIGDEAIAAMAFERFRNELRRALAGPVLGDRRRDAREQRFCPRRLRSGRAPGPGASTSTSSPRSRLPDPR